MVSCTRIAISCFMLIAQQSTHPDIKLHNAAYLDIILYSREQVLIERAAMNDESPVPDAPWGIVRCDACWLAWWADCLVACLVAWCVR